MYITTGRGFVTSQISYSNIFSHFAGPSIYLGMWTFSFDFVLDPHTTTLGLGTAGCHAQRLQAIRRNSANHQKSCQVMCLELVAARPSSLRFSSPLSLLSSHHCVNVCQIIPSHWSDTTWPSHSHYHRWQQQQKGRQQ